MSEGDVDHGFRGRVAEFIVFTESARPLEPIERALHDPAPGQHLKLVQLVAFDPSTSYSNMSFA